MLWLRTKTTDNIPCLSHTLSRPRTLFFELRLPPLFESATSTVNRKVNILNSKHAKQIIPPFSNVFTSLEGRKTHHKPSLSEKQRSTATSLFSPCSGRIRSYHRIHHLHLYQMTHLTVKKNLLTVHISTNSQALTTAGSKVTHRKRSRNQIHSREGSGICSMQSRL